MTDKLFTGTKVYIEQEIKPPYHHDWVIKEYPSGKLFQVFRDKDTAKSTVRGFGMELVCIISKKVGNG